MKALSLTPSQAEAYRQWRPSALAYLRDLVLEETSIDIDVGRISLWHSRLSPIMRSAEICDPSELLDRLQSGDQGLRRKVVDAMTTHETLFFRDSAVFESSLRILIPEIVDRCDGSRPATIWSAASSSGQEIYSVAMFLDRYFPELLAEGKVQLFASDVSHGMVERVKEAKFTPLEVRRGLPKEYRDRYLKFNGEHWEVSAHLRELVTARVVNLMRPLTMLPRCDLILLRNVLIYFSPVDRMTLLNRLRNEVLAQHGALVLGSSELLNGRTESFEPERVGSGVCYRPTKLPRSTGPIDPIIG